MIAVFYSFLYIEYMITQRKNKLKKLLSEWPPGAIYTQVYLTSRGYSGNLVKAYRRNHWIESIGTGAYRRFNDQIDWIGGLYAIQNQLKMPIHAGGKTALELQGYSHYARNENSSVFLFGPNGKKPPKWFMSYDWGVKIIYKSTGVLPFNLKESFTEYRHHQLEVRISAPERAIMEILYLVPLLQGFDEAFKLMEMLTSLRPGLLQKLLEGCQSYKVKRLFLYMAEKISYPWFRQLELRHIDLGRGNREVVKNGRFDKRYLITVPKEYSS